MVLALAATTSDDSEVMRPRQYTNSLLESALPAVQTHMQQVQRAIIKARIANRKASLRASASGLRARSLRASDSLTQQSRTAKRHGDAAESRKALVKQLLATSHTAQDLVSAQLKLATAAYSSNAKGECTMNPLVQESFAGLLDPLQLRRQVSCCWGGPTHNQVISDAELAAVYGAIGTCTSQASLLQGQEFLKWVGRGLEPARMAMQARADANGAARVTVLQAAGVNCDVLRPTPLGR